MVPGYRHAWLDGFGPGQPPKHQNGERPTPRVRIEAAFRRYVLSRRPQFAPDMTFEQTLDWLSARPWSEIVATIGHCVQCDEFRGGRCTRHGESCQARTKWMSHILRRKCKRETDEFPEGNNWFCAFKPTNLIPPYLATADLARDALSLIPRLPPDITAVYASARSGLVPGTLLAEMLHLPLTVIRNRQGDTVPAGHGWRLLEGAPTKPGKVLVVDDTTMTGNSLLRVKQILQGTPGEKIYCAVYVNPDAVTKPDLWAVDLPWPHLLEWNLFNSVLLDSFALDFDGILCHDCAPADDDDGERYLEFLRQTKPLHLVRKRPIRLIVTARLEKYRAETLEWMNRWGIRVKDLIMGPWATKAERARDDVAAWKAEQLKKFFRKRPAIKPSMFVESDPGQARRIAELTGGLVVCPPAKRCFR